MDPTVTRIASANTTSTHAPSFLKSLVLACGTLALSTWALGTLWLAAESPAADQVAAAAAAE